MMIIRVFQIIFFAVLIYIVIGVVKFIFRLGRTTAELNSKLDEKNRNAAGNRRDIKGNEIIELDKDQYKVE